MPDAGSTGGPDGGSGGGACPYVPQCRPDGCERCTPFYCDDTLPNPPAVPGIDPNADPATDSTVAGLSAALAAARNVACDPGSTCEPNESIVPACILRQVVGHYVVRALPPGATQGLTEGATGVQGLASALAGDVLPDIFFDERLADTHVRWVEHFDGGLQLQGYLELTIRLASPNIDIDAVNALLQFDIGIVQIEDAAFRLRLQPYFHAMAPAGGVCDSCGRRRPDETLHWALADARLVVDHQPGTDPDTEASPAVSGCSFGCLQVTSCYLQHCDPQQVPTGDAVRELEDVGSVFDETLASQLANVSLQSLDRLTWQVSSDPLVGGIFFGRAAAVDALTDAPLCPPAPTPPPAPAPRPPPSAVTPNPACTGGGTGHDTLAIADAIEHLRIRRGIAEVGGRDNR